MKAMVRMFQQTVLCLICVSIATVASAADNDFVTVDDLVKDGYIKLSGIQISELMSKHEIQVVDIETDAVTISRRDTGEVAMERKFERSKPNNAVSMMDPRLLARAPPLEGKLERKVAVDALVVTDGVRTYRYSIYKKQNNLFAVRDIDSGFVFFKVTVK